MQSKIIDIHCHILPGIDDGPKTEKESLAMVAEAAKQGVGAIVATPHYIPGEIEYAPEVVYEKVAHLQSKVDEAGIQCKIYPGMELYLVPDLIRHLDQGKLISLAKSKYFLVEFPSSSLSQTAINLLHEIRVRGYYPVIAHPERNSVIASNPEIVNEFLQYQALLQVNAASILGTNGKSLQQLALNFAQQGVVSFIGSDGHSTERRAIHLLEAYNYLNNQLSPGIFKSVFSTNGEKIITNEPIAHIKTVFENFKPGLFNNLRRILSFR